MIFRGTVEDYESAGILPSVFMDSNGNLQIYLCDSIVDEGNNETVEIEAFEMNGGQFVETIDVKSEGNKISSKPEF